MKDAPPPCIGDFRDYRAYLLEHYHWRKQRQPWYSYRILATRLEMDVSHVYRILKGRIHLSPEVVPRVVKLLGLEGDAAEGFEHLVTVGRRHRYDVARRSVTRGC